MKGCAGVVVAAAVVCVYALVGEGRRQGALMKLLCWYTVGVPVRMVFCGYV